MNVENEVSDMAQRVIDGLTTVIRNSPTGVSFIAINGYENKKGERANLLINVGMSYEKQIAKDIKTLTDLDILTVEEIEDKVLGERAKQELIASFGQPHRRQSEAQISAFGELSDALKIHHESGTVYVQGYLVKKDVIVEGNRRTTNSAPKTILKNILREKFCSTANYRQYAVESIGDMSVNGNTISFAPVRLQS